MTIPPPLFSVPRSWVTPDVLAAAGDLPWLSDSGGTGSPAHASAFLPPVPPSSPALRPETGLHCVPSERTELVIGKGDATETRLTRRPPPELHLISAVLKRDRDGEEIRIAPTWDPFEAAAKAADALQRHGSPGEDFRITIHLLSRPGRVWRPATDERALRESLAALEVSEKARIAAKAGEPYRGGQRPLTREDATLYEAKFAVFPLQGVTMMDVQSFHRAIDEENREIRFELQQYNPVFGKTPAKARTRAVLRLSAADWESATEARGWIWKKRALRPSNFMTLLTREFALYAMRERLTEMFLEVWTETR